MREVFILFEDSTGFGLFKRLQGDEIGDIQSSISDLSRFSKMVTLQAYQPYSSAEIALDVANSLSEGIVPDTLSHFLEANLPSKAVLGIQDQKLAGALQEQFGYSCDSSAKIIEFSRGLRLHFHRYVKALEANDREKAQLGLSHSYSRSKVKFNVDRVDNMVIQSIAMLDYLDKDLNTFAMRVKEWYGWHFPELKQLLNDNYLYAKICLVVGNKSKLGDDQVEEMEKVLGDSDLVQSIVEAAKTSMGTDISDIDLLNIDAFAKNVVSLAEYRKELFEYLQSKMKVVAPNLTALIGELVGARLISHAGSLTNLAKYPASTVQILGAEKALFRALKKKTNTPKYGLLFGSSYIGKAAPKNKGRIARFLANKCTIASRIDCFSEVPTDVFGEKLQEQVEERLKFFETGDIPKKNVDAMAEAVAAFKATQSKKSPASKKKTPSKRVLESESETDETPVKKSKKSKDSSSKKEKSSSSKKEKSSSKKEKSSKSSKKSKKSE